MKEIICPHCKKAFKVDEAGFADILKQVRDHEFEKERDEIASELKNKESEIQLHDIALKEKYATELKTKDDIIKMRDEEIELRKDLKVKLSTKMVGETFEQHCEIEFNKLRATGFQNNAYFEKDNDIKTDKINSEGGFETSRNGAVFERFENCVPDIESWLEKGRKLGYKKIIVIGHSLGVSKVLHHFYKTKPEDVVGVILASPPDMVGLVKKTSYQPNYEKLLEEAKQNIQNNNPRKLLSEEVWNWYTLSSLN